MMAFFVEQLNKLRRFWARYYVVYLGYLLACIFALKFLEDSNAYYQTEPGTLKMKSIFGLCLLLPLLVCSSLVVIPELVGRVKKDLRRKRNEEAAAKKRRADKLIARQRYRRFINIGVLPDPQTADRIRVWEILDNLIKRKWNISGHVPTKTYGASQFYEEYSDIKVANNLTGRDALNVIDEAAQRSGVSVNEFQVYDRARMEGLTAMFDSAFSRIFNSPSLSKAPAKKPRIAYLQTSSWNSGTEWVDDGKYSLSRAVLVVVRHQDGSFSCLEWEWTDHGRS